ncbi:MAG: DUF1579 family protein [Phycisphaerales bacterium]|nr:DUF1579 family protein [Phycisphaerales bacterium]
MNRLSVLLLAAGLAIAPFALAQPAAPAKPAKPAAPAAPAPTATPAKPAEAEKAPEGDKPGEAHKWMGQFVGDWTVTFSAMADGKAKEVATAEFSAKYVMGEKFLHMEWDGRWQGQFYRQIGSLGYCNAHKQYEYSAISSRGTATEFLTGSVSSDGKVLTLSGDGVHDGTKGKLRAVVTVVSKDKVTDEFFFTAAGGKEAKVMEATYTRGKGEAKKDKDEKKDEKKPAEAPKPSTGTPAKPR